MIFYRPPRAPDSTYDLEWFEAMVTRDQVRLEKAEARRTQAYKVWRRASDRYNRNFHRGAKALSIGGFSSAGWALVSALVALIFGADIIPATTHWAIWAGSGLAPGLGWWLWRKRKDDAKDIMEELIQ